MIHRHQPSPGDSTERTLFAKLTSPRFLAIFFFLVLPVLLFLCVIAWWFGRQRIASTELAQKRAEISARGLPIDHESLLAYRMAMMDSTKSDAWVSLLKHLDSDAFAATCEGVPIVGYFEGEVPFEPGQPYPHDAAVTKFLGRWKDLRAELHDLTEGTDSIWTPAGQDEFLLMNLTTVTSVRTVARLLSLEFEDAIRRDDADQAMHSLLALNGTARTMHEEPFLVSQLVSTAIQGVALSRIEMAAELNLFDETQWKAVADDLCQMNCLKRRFEISLAGERAWSQVYFDSPERMQAEMDEAVPTRLLGPRSIDALASLAIYERLEQIQANDLTTFYRQVLQVESDFNQQMQNANWLEKFDTRMTGLSTPSLSAYARALVSETMQARLAKTAIGVRLFQGQNDRWPDDLSELTTEAIGIDLGVLDPIGGKPFGYRVKDGVAELWGFEPETPDASTPNEPPLVDDPFGTNARWVWRLPK